MADNKNNIIELIEPIINEESCELVDVHVTHEEGRKIVRVFIDKEGGVILEDCSRVSHAIEDVMEVEDVVDGKYHLEVSSPGLNRPLRTVEHYQKVLGQTVQFATKEKIDGRKRYKGILKDVSASNVVVEIDNKDFTVPLTEIEKSHLVYEFK